MQGCSISCYFSIMNMKLIWFWIFVILYKHYHYKADTNINNKLVNKIIVGFLSFFDEPHTYTKNSVIQHKIWYYGITIPRSKSPMISQTNGPKVPWSQNPMASQSHGRKVSWSQSHMVKRVEFLKNCLVMFLNVLYM